MYIISNSKKFIFIHTPKTGGTSIFVALRHYGNKYNQLKDKELKRYRMLFLLQEHFSIGLFKTHVSANRLKQKAPKAIWDKYFTFGFVRNPYDWLYSYYRFVHRYEKHAQDKFFKTHDNFRDFVYEMPTNFKLPQQHSYLCDKKGTIIVDYVGRFENLRRCFNRNIRPKLNLEEPIKIRHRNKDKSNPIPYTEIYDKKMIQKVNEVFEKDFIIFEYKML